MKISVFAKIIFKNSILALNCVYLTQFISTDSRLIKMLFTCSCGIVCGNIFLFLIVRQRRDEDSLRKYAAFVFKKENEQQPACQIIKELIFRNNFFPIFCYWIVKLIKWWGIVSGSVRDYILWLVLHVTPKVPIPLRIFQWRNVNNLKSIKYNIRRAMLTEKATSGNLFQSVCVPTVIFIVWNFT